MAKSNATDFHDFYCINCGNKSMTLPRLRSHQHAKLHLKKLWCIHCKQEFNHVEVKNEQDYLIFKENFEAGVYKDELYEK